MMMDNKPDDGYVPADLTLVPTDELLDELEKRFQVSAMAFEIPVRNDDKISETRYRYSGGSSAGVGIAFKLLIYLAFGWQLHKIRDKLDSLEKSLIHCIFNSPAYIHP